MPNAITRVEFSEVHAAFERMHGTVPAVLRVREEAWNEIRRWSSEYDTPSWRDLEQGTRVVLFGCRVICEYAGPDGVSGDFTYDFLTEDDLARRIAAASGPPGETGPTGSDENGLIGVTGLPGRDGMQGPDGVQGRPGVRGPDGVQGPTSNPGLTSFDMHHIASSLACMTDEEFVLVQRELLDLLDARSGVTSPRPPRARVVEL